MTRGWSPGDPWDTRQTARDQAATLAEAAARGPAARAAAADACLSAHRRFITSLAVNECDHARRSWSMIGEDLIQTGLEHLAATIASVADDPGRVTDPTVTLAGLVRSLTVKQMRKWLLSPAGTEAGVTGSYWAQRRHLEFLHQAAAWEAATGAWPGRATEHEFLSWANGRIRARTGDRRLLIAWADSKRPVAVAAPPDDGDGPFTTGVDAAIGTDAATILTDAVAATLRWADQRGPDIADVARHVAATILAPDSDGRVGAFPTAARLAAALPHIPPGRVRTAAAEVSETLRSHITIP